MKRLHWRKAKTLAMLTNRRQWEREFGTSLSSETEIKTEQGVFIITETSSSATPEYIITE